MSTGKIILGALIGVGAIAAIPFTAGGSVLGGATLLASLAGAEALAIGAGVAGGVAGAAMGEKQKKDRKNENENRFKEGAKAGENATKEKFSSILKTQKERDVLVLISIKLGIYIAKIDNDLHSKEIEEINYLYFIVSNSPNTPVFVKSEIKKMLNINFKISYEEIIGEVKEFLEAKNSNEKKEFYEYFDKLIRKIIYADGHCHPAELDFLKKWMVELINF